MSFSGLRRQEELVNGGGNFLNFPPSNLIMWEKIYPNEKQTWANRVGLIKNKTVFIDTNGKLTNILPNSGWMQNIGFCYENEKLYVNINLQLTML